MWSCGPNKTRLSSSGSAFVCHLGTLFSLFTLGSINKPGLSHLITHLTFSRGDTRCVWGAGTAGCIMGALPGNDAMAQGINMMDTTTSPLLFATVSQWETRPATFKPMRAQVLYLHMGVLDLRSARI